jgi:hypothetical protein
MLLVVVILNRDFICISALERLIHLRLVLFFQGENWMQGLIGVLEETLCLLEVSLLRFKPFRVEIAQETINRQHKVENGEGGHDDRCDAV